MWEDEVKRLWGQEEGGKKVGFSIVRFSASWQHLKFMARANLTNVFKLLLTHF